MEFTVTVESEETCSIGGAKNPNNSSMLTLIVFTEIGAIFNIEVKLSWGWILGNLLKIFLGGKITVISTSEEIIGTVKLVSIKTSGDFCKKRRSPELILKVLESIKGWKFFLIVLCTLFSFDLRILNPREI